MQSLGLDSEVGCIFKAPLHLVLVQGMVFTQWYLTYFLLPFLINFLKAYLSGWGGECVCGSVCVLLDFDTLKIEKNSKIEKP